LLADETSCALNHEPYRTDQDRIEGRSTPVPSSCVDQFWLPATTCTRVPTCGDTYSTPGSSDRASASSGVSEVFMPEP
jgi:hypothetical protein